MVYVQEYLNTMMWKVSTRRICNVIAEVLGSRTSPQTMSITSVLEQPEVTSISTATASRWLAKLGWIYGRNKKGYVDGHEREDVVEYRMKIFLPAMEVCSYQTGGYQALTALTEVLLDDARV